MRQCRTRRRNRQEGSEEQREIGIRSRKKEREETVSEYRNEHRIIMKIRPTFEIYNIREVRTLKFKISKTSENSVI